MEGRRRSSLPSDERCRAARTIRMQGYRLVVKSARREPLPHRPPPLGLRRHYAAVRPEADQQPHPAAPRMYVVCFVHLGSAGPADAPHPSGRSALIVWVGIHRPPRGGACFLSSRCYGDSWARLRPNLATASPLTVRQARPVPHRAGIPISTRSPCGRRFIACRWSLLRPPGSQVAFRLETRS
jgi:hypothetical protein